MFFLQSHPPRRDRVPGACRRDPDRGAELLAHGDGGRGHARVRGAALKETDQGLAARIARARRAAHLPHALFGKRVEEAQLLEIGFELADRFSLSSERIAKHRFDAFASLPHMPMLGGRTFSAPLTALGAVYYSLRDRFGI